MELKLSWNGSANPHYFKLMALNPIGLKKIPTEPAAAYLLIYHQLNLSENKKYYRFSKVLSTKKETAFLIFSRPSGVLRSIPQKMLPFTSEYRFR